jgi:uncharacterized RDD family membrane protein YckC
MVPVKTTTDGVPLASWGRRFGAWLIDGVILLGVVVILWAVLAPEFWTAIGHLFDVAATGDPAATERASQELQTTVQEVAPKVGIAQFLAVFAYCVGFWTWSGQTPGKMAVGISVRRADRPGPLDLPTAVRRRLLSLVQVVPFIGLAWVALWPLDGLFPLWDNQQQALHDKVAQTQVVMGKQPRKGA